MSQQRSLPFDRTELLDSLWPGLPEPAREQVIVLYAGLIARSSRGGVAAPPRPAASVSQSLDGHAVPERVQAVLGSEAPADRSPQAALDSPGAAIATPMFTEPTGATNRALEDSTSV